MGKAVATATHSPECPANPDWWWGSGGRWKPWETRPFRTTSGKRYIPSICSVSYIWWLSIRVMSVWICSLNFYPIPGYIQSRYLIWCILILIFKLWYPSSPIYFNMEHLSSTHPLNHHPSYGRYAEITTTKSKCCFYEGVFYYKGNTVSD